LSETEYPSVTSLLLENPSDFVVINNIAEEIKPEVVTLNEEMLNAWNSNDLFDSGSEHSNSKVPSEQEFMSESPDWSPDSGSSGSDHPVLIESSPSVDTETFSNYGFSPAFDNSYVSFDNFEATSASPLFMKDSLDYSTSVPYPVNAYSSGYGYSTSITSLAAHNLFPQPQISVIDDDSMKVDDYDMFESMNDCSFDIDFAQGRSDYFSVHVSDLI